MRYTPKDFASECPPPRIMGSETEYTVQADSATPAMDLVSMLHQESAVQFAYNGARIYHDCDQLEYATPECLGPLEATAAEFAGIQRIERTISVRGLQKTYAVYRRSGHAAYLDWNEPSRSKKAETSGYHENYLLADKYLGDRAAVIVKSFLATRAIWAGSGLQEQFGYFLSQKANGVSSKNSIAHITHHGDKPMYLIKPVSGNKRFSRLEIRCGDPNMSPRMTYLRFAATSLVLRMLERTDFLDLDTYRRLALTKPHEILHAVSADADLYGIYMNRGHERLTAVEHQNLFLEQARRLNKEVELPPDEIEAIDLWETIQRRIEATYPENKLDSIVDDIDWAAKLYLADDAIAREKMPDTPEARMQFDIKWEKLGNGIGQRWWAKRQERFIAKLDPAVKPLVDHPPQQTRAKARVELQRRYTYPGVSWQTFGVTDMHDPYEHDFTAFLPTQRKAS